MTSDDDSSESDGSDIDLWMCAKGAAGNGEEGNAIHHGKTGRRGEGGQGGNEGTKGGEKAAAAKTRKMGDEGGKGGGAGWKSARGGKGGQPLSEDKAETARAVQREVAEANRRRHVLDALSTSNRRWNQHVYLGNPVTCASWIEPELTFILRVSLLDQ